MPSLQRLRELIALGVEDGNVLTLSQVCHHLDAKLKQMARSMTLASEQLRGGDDPEAVARLLDQVRKVVVEDWPDG